MKSISRRQLRSREAWWEGSRRQSRGAMNNKAILGLASGASGHHAAKPFGLGRRVDDTFARWKLMFLSGEASLACGSSRRTAPSSATAKTALEESAESIVVARNEPGVAADG
jgi:hypothetical protein